MYLHRRTGVGSGCVGGSNVCHETVILRVDMIVRDCSRSKFPTGGQTVLFVRLVYGFSMPRRCSDIWSLVDGDEMAILGERDKSVVIYSVGT